MNVTRLLEFIDEVLEIESRRKIQDRLVKLDQELQNIVNQPQEATHQTNTAARLNEFKDALTNANAEMTPAAWQFLIEIDASWAFDPSLAETISKEMAENAMTPAVVKSSVEKWVEKRKKLLDYLNGAKKNLTNLGFKKTELEPGTAELGFLIPRDLFQNTLAGLAAEFKQIDRVVGWFSEALKGEREEATLEGLSTTDPSVLIGAATDVVLAIGATVTFLLTTYKQIVDIKEVRERTRGLKIANDEALKPFDDHINKVVNQAMDQRIKELLPKKRDGRDNELEGGLLWSMRYLMSRVERGMTIEVKFLPPVQEPNQEGQADSQPDRTADKEKEIFDKLSQVQQDLMFNVITGGEPILTLEPPAPPEADGKMKMAKRRSRKAKDDKAAE